ncbi:ATP-binding region ATPase domain protein [Gemmatirosa kalamazoonensis]|uniref:histidine kinase n=1 Tax=Gemmatirosa kalamazoonensis TaxID=861299 RepID=W0RDD2_9BACT|nr:ATP-binding protein [Gemmatirosa kalamazoonensis]AHG89124.1 ATP-binding region ATPase domain protein [Gemmatirosa kalamazoonensis]
MPRRLLHVSGVRAWVVSFGLLFAISALFIANRALLNQRQAPVALTLLMVVLFGSVLGGRALGLAIALGGFLIINYFFQFPYFDIAVHDPADWLVLVTFVVTADVASRLLARAQRQTAAAQRRAAEVQRLADLGAETLAAGTSVQALQAVADVVATTLHLDWCELWDVAADGAARRVAASPPAPAAESTAVDPALLARLRESASTAARQGADERARAFDEILAAAPTDALVPLSAHDRAVGALRLRRSRPLALDESERTFLQALAHYAALGVERARLAADVRRAELEREAERARDFLFATVSHDLRTPLTTIKALAHERARDGDASALVIEEQADRLTRMVTDLLDLSRARAGALPLAPELNTAEDVVGATLRHAAGALRGRAVETRLDDAGGALVGHFDFVATLRILGNLIENAAKYSPATEPIRLEVVRDGGALVFTVADRGPGIPAEERERVFVPFHRAPGAAPDVGGTGLGLAVARALAEAQRGTVTYTPAEGGSVFTLRLPASDDALALEIIAGAS